MKKNRNINLANPLKLTSLNGKKEKLIHVVVETPKGSRNKYSFDPHERVFALKKVLPAGMTFPYDFGFVPSTEADDGDPVDVLVLMDEPAFPGVVLKCRIIGIIEGEQGNGKNTERNDRVVAVESANHQWAHVRHIDDLGKRFIEEIGEFFVDYHRLGGQEFRVLNIKGPKAAQKCVKRGMNAIKKSHAA